MIKQAVISLKKTIGYVDWKLLVFLVLFLNIKLPVKIIAIMLVYALQFNFKFGFKLKNSRLPLFYLLIIPIAFLGLIINKNYQYPNYLLLFFTGIGFWLMSILAVHQIKLMVEKTDIETINRTIIAFFIINAVISLTNLVFIMYQTGSINPYTFRGLYQTYFINTGDDIKGITFDISSTNAVLSALGAIYFLVKEKPLMLCVCMCSLLLTYSNLISLVLFSVLILLLIFKSTAIQKSMIVICVALLMIFMVKVSPENKKYVTQSTQHFLHKDSYSPDKPLVKEIPITERPDSQLNPDERKRKFALLYLDSVHNILKTPHFKSIVPINANGKIVIPAPDTNAEQYYLSKEIEPDRKLMLNFISIHKANLVLSTQQNYAPAIPGKLTGMIQTVRFLQYHPAGAIAGLGIGNFSSKIAFRAVGLGMRGRYPEKHEYIHPAFLKNHLDLYLSYFSKSVAYRSVMNNPFSVYDQLLTEYGLIGLLALLIYYFGFFVKRYKALTYGVPMLLFVAGIFFIDYWFEQLSVLILFELMLFMDMKEHKALVDDLNMSHAN
ncbi:MAG: hypothetical protein V4592_02340 [Bacteroidota bacterium]